MLLESLYSVIDALNNPKGKLARSEVRRQYKHNLVEYPDGEITLIPYEDSRLNYLIDSNQNCIIKLNQRIRETGNCINGNTYSLPEGFEDDNIKDDLEYISEECGHIDKRRFMILSHIVALFVMFVFLGLHEVGNGNPINGMAEVFEILVLN